jgi:nuclear inhibitor of protein phosphatase 1
VDLGSTHGTFIGNIRLDSHKPTVVQINSSFHFGASTRNYTLREKPKTQIVEEIPNTETGLPESQDDVDNLTEYNTAHNRKISTLGITELPVKKGAKRKRVHFNEEEIIINPEDVDPSIGRFRNLVQSTVVPVTNKRLRLDSGSFSFPPNPASQHENKHILHHPIIAAPNLINLYAGLPSTSNELNDRADENIGSYTTKFMANLPNPAPDIDVANKTSAIQLPHDEMHEHIDYEHEPKKKKYAKESWFGPKKAKTSFGDI